LETDIVEHTVDGLGTNGTPRKVHSFSFVCIGSGVSLLYATAGIHCMIIFCLQLACSLTSSASSDDLDSTYSPRHFSLGFALIFPCIRHCSSPGGRGVHPMRLLLQLWSKRLHVWCHLATSVYRLPPLSLHTLVALSRRPRTRDQLDMHLKWGACSRPRAW
jgi:hypothetical protein